MATNGEIEIKQGLLLKRSINRSAFTTENYRTRLFILSRLHLRYFDGKQHKKGKEKGKIALEHVKVIEEVDDRMLDNRDNVFQIVYKQSSDTYTLYIVAVDDTSRQEWIEAIRAECKKNGARFLPKYHKGVWTKGHGKYNCCDQIDRNAPGCELVENTHTSSVTEPHGGRRQPLPPTPRIPDPAAAEPEKVFIAVYDFEPAEDEDLELIRGEEYVILNDSKEHWWQARDKNGKRGYIPSNYVKQRYGLELYGWYYKDLTRNRSEMILLKESEGCFLVRDSTSTPGLYTVSVYTGDGGSIVKHYHIHTNEQGKFFISTKHCFDSIPDLVHYHRHNAGGLSTRLRDPPARDNKPSTAGMGHSKWEIDPSELIMGELLGAGCFGSVYQGRLKGQAVAVKTLKEMAMSESSFIEEAKTMTQISHPNLVQLYGIVTVKKPLMIVTELMRSGALISYLKRHSDIILNKPADMLDYCVQICSGMVYLEERKFIHRDLAARNCLVGENKVVKVADFGLTRYVIDDEYTSSVGTKFPVKWAPPEVLSFTKFSSKSDIWAFGVLMWEIFTAGETPYGRMKNSDVVEYVVSENKRLQKPPAAPDIIYRIMKKCWKLNAESRPTFIDLLKELKGLADTGNYPTIN